MYALYILYKNVTAPYAKECMCLHVTLTTTFMLS